jgi:transposase
MSSLPSCLDDYVGEDNPARVIDVFVEKLDLGALGFEVGPAVTGRPAYRPATLLKLYVYGYLNRVPSSRRLEREAQRNVELMWLTGKLAPDHKTIANFRKDHGPPIQAACAHFVALCRQIGLFTQALAAVDGSKFKAVNTRHKNFIATKPKKRMEQVAEHIAGYLASGVTGGIAFDYTATAGTPAYAGTPTYVDGFDGALPHYSFVSRGVFSPTGAVPEPATWAMMLLGVAALGAALRSRRRDVTIAA